MNSSLPFHKYNIIQLFTVWSKTQWEIEKWPKWPESTGCSVTALMKTTIMTRNPTFILGITSLAVSAQIQPTQVHCMVRFFDAFFLTASKLTCSPKNDFEVSGWCNWNLLKLQEIRNFWNLQTSKLADIKKLWLAKLKTCRN